MPDRPPLPARLFELTDALVRAGWSYQVLHQRSIEGLDGEPGHPFVTVEAKREGAERLIVTWHTRETGTYRLSSVLLIGHQGGTYADALRYAKGDQ